MYYWCFDSFIGGSRPLLTKAASPLNNHICISSMFFMLLRVTIFLFFLYADNPLALQSPEYCFVEGLTCGISREYPMISFPESSNSCGYPGLEIGCDPSSYGGRPFMNISNHIYHVLDIDYQAEQFRLVDIDVERNDCPQPKRNFSLPSSPSWVNYSLPNSTNYNVTVFYNCSSVPADAEQYLFCSDEYYNTTNTPPSYAFRNNQIPKGSDWYRNCARNVIVPGYYTGGLIYRDVMELGFVLKWSATGWCGDCERSGGQCWANSTATGCACQNGMSYNSTCLQPGVPPTPSTTVKSQRGKRGMGIGLKIGIGVLVGIGGLLLIALLIFFKGAIYSSLCMLHWRNITKSPFDEQAFLERYNCTSLQSYKYLDIKKMTNSFKDRLGEGGYGRVFKGELRDGRLVAVKVLNEPKGDGDDFINEVATIGKTNHINVVTLVGFCIEGSKRALVYEFMPNGSLERFIYTRTEFVTTPPLGWEKLYEIALGIARGLEYLHRGCNTRILHFDIKPHNILLDQDFCPKISDFGLAKLYQTRESIYSAVGARGTMGYIAPELCCGNFGGASHKSDVYSYGMMMLEMIGGRKNFDVTVENTSEIDFPFWVYNHLIHYNDAKSLKNNWSNEVFEDKRAKKMIIVALWCIQAHPMERPSMNKVVEMLEGNIQDLQIPPNPTVDPRPTSATSS